MSSYQGLKHSSVRAAFDQMAQRAWVAAPFHILLFSYAVFSVPSDKRGFWLYLAFGVIWMVAGVRFYLRLYGNRILKDPEGQLKWRLIFGINSLVLALTWGLVTAFCLYREGASLRYVGLLTICAGISAASLPSFSFDGLVSIAFQILIIGIPAAMALFRFSTMPGLAIGGVLGTIFFTYCSISLHRFQVTFLRNVEIIEEQREELQQALQELEDAHGTIQQMLDSIQEAFLLLDLKGNCINSASQRSKDLLGLDPSGLNFVDFMRIESPKEREKVESWFQVLSSERLDFEKIAALGIKTIEEHPSGKYLRLNYHPMRNDQGRLTAVILTVADVTDEMNARRMADETRARALLILKILESPSRFRAFIRDFDQQLSTLCRCTNGDEAGARRTLHTLKGTSALFYVTSISRKVYDVERRIVELMEKGEDFLGHLRKFAAELSQDFRDWQDSERALLSQLGVFDTGMLRIPESRLADLERIFSQDVHSSRVILLARKVLESSELSEILSSYASQISLISAKLGKKVDCNVKGLDGPIHIPSESYSEVFSSLVHLFNNAVDHGIETPEERLAAGKSDTGHVQILFGRLRRNDRAWLRILVEDDGAGINIERLRIGLAKKRINTDSMSDSEVADLIFSDGVTSRPSVSEISGQGIGMAAVREVIQNAGGIIRILKSGKNGTGFEIILPDNSIDLDQEMTKLPLRVA